MSTDDALNVYGLSKQVNEGDVTGSKPSFLNIVGRVLYEAWEKYKGTSRKAAIEQFIPLARPVIEKKCNFIQYDEELMAQAYDQCIS